MTAVAPQPNPLTYFSGRHALGLPAGSIRALHVLGVAGILCAILLMPTEPPIALPPYLVYLLFLILGHFFGSHGTTIATRADTHASPLYLPGGAVRLIVVLMLAGTLCLKWFDAPDRLKQQFEASLDLVKAQPFMPLVILGGFFFGTLVRGVIGRHPMATWQDFEAWVSVLALIGLFAAAVIHLIIAPSLANPERADWPIWESILGGVIAFYFGERS